MLKFKNTLEVIEQSSWQPAPNVIYLINNVQSLKEFFKKEFPELADIDLNIDIEKDKEKFEEVWNHKNPYFKNFQSKIGLRPYYYIRQLFNEEFVDKKGSFLFQLIFIFKMYLPNGEDYFYFDTINTFISISASKKEKSLILEESLLNFRDSVIEKLKDEFDNELVISAREK